MKLYRVKVNGKVYEVEVEAVEEVSGSVAPAPVREAAPEKSEGGKEILAPIAGKVLEIRVKPGECISKGQTVMIVEAMKLENEIQSAYDGVVRQILVENGSDVRNKDVLIVLD